MVWHGIDYPDAQQNHRAYEISRRWKLAYELIFCLFASRVFFRSLYGGRPSVNPITRPKHPRLIVGLTTIPSRIRSAHLVIESLMRQTLPPDEIVLSVPTGVPIPLRLRHLQKRGLVISRQLPSLDLLPHNKLLVPLARNPDAIIVTADDDLLYPKRWLECLYMTWQANPEKIICHNALRIKKTADHSLAPYTEWLWRHPCPNANIHPRGGMGVLYLPHCLPSDVADAKLIKRLCPTADDVWFKAMTLRGGTQIRNISLYEANGFIRVPHDFQKSLYYQNRKSIDGNDEQARRVFSYYDLYHLLDKS